MAHVSVVDDLADCPPDVLAALLRASDEILAKWVSPWPSPASEEEI
jgi:hypothetical protein